MKRPASAPDQMEVEEKKDQAPDQMEVEEKPEQAPDTASDKPAKVKKPAKPPVMKPQKKPAHGESQWEPSSQNFCEFFLAHCISQCSKESVKMLTRKLQDRPLTLTSGCSGSGMAEVAPFPRQ